MHCNFSIGQNFDLKFFIFLFDVGQMFIFLKYLESQSFNFLIFVFNQLTQVLNVYLLVQCVHLSQIWPWLGLTEFVGQTTAL